MHDYHTAFGQSHQMRSNDEVATSLDKNVKNPTKHKISNKSQNELNLVVEPCRILVV